MKKFPGPGDWERGGIPPDERPTSYELSVPEDPSHGVDGHSGYRCYQCALISPGLVMIAVAGGDYWQNLQLSWQEECDKLQNLYDDAVALHFPIHIDSRLLGKDETCDCPKPQQMPPKPIPPAERSVTQAARD